MNEEKLDEVLRRVSREYNVPPDTPREEMWQEIRASLGPREDSTTISLERERMRRRLVSASVPGLAVAAAALVVLGIGIGRMTARPGSPVPGATPAMAAGPSPVEATRVATLRHLSRSESLLSLVRADANDGRLDRQVGSWGRGLLVETRLLLDSDALEDVAIRRLLEDLELILAQVALLSDDGGVDEGRARKELRLIADGLEDQNVLTRIQAVLPAEPAQSTM